MGASVTLQVEFVVTIDYHIVKKQYEKLGKKLPNLTIKEHVKSEGYDWFEAEIMGKGHECQEEVVWKWVRQTLEDHDLQDVLEVIQLTDRQEEDYVDKIPEKWTLVWKKERKHNYFSAQQCNSTYIKMNPQDIPHLANEFKNICSPLMKDFGFDEFKPEILFESTYF